MEKYWPGDVGHRELPAVTTRCDMGDFPDVPDDDDRDPRREDYDLAVDDSDD